ncbi:hypothetical protein [Aliarcobacter cibarius]|jgi:hypothetical protein|uniref:Uncharacterized protein n=1 Tax=Aliarcobacter cibarius TaxID=255507 RepID=A0A5J6RGN5_9BACT|nr:hypothetical protein [Aliarcobacter cibarius]QEZ89104.1 hypothetical protein ACIB15232_0986 [Aliarcobacter cibarius]QKJ27124.1 hypothetical protein ACBT_1215 [Aliarcobacter cibarius]TLS95362.1 hypothetical protein FE247_11110 [Aliarcobacter cibarius]TLS95760.1 hypothetical protein FE245_11200 [Aliarcobacter cibarius]TLT02605.1 hypothetical protein FE248_09895 [Aliarcobacter cibarius]
MKIIGDSIVPFEEFFKVSNVEEIKNTKPNSLIFFEYNEELLKYCYLNNLNYFVQINSVKEGLYANSLNAKYIVCKKTLAKKMQKIAENYMFDSKILAIIKSNDELEEIALDEIDGVIYKELI